MYTCTHIHTLGRDVIAQAQSGTGKTATFAVSILQKLDTAKMQCQALVLAPTRELAQQIQKVTFWLFITPFLLYTCTVKLFSS